jgi:hypothetical protein
MSVTISEKPSVFLSLLGLVLIGVICWAGMHFRRAEDRQCVESGGRVSYGWINGRRVWACQGAERSTP